ncbi:MAG TPA: hypothetical protein VFY23_05395 [Candidatus Limnocylindrales bacterium]|nr:hypothetical protein [Candidatus Limnocylindrales bacterium]
MLDERRAAGLGGPAAETASSGEYAPEDDGEYEDEEEGASPAGRR